MNDAPIAASFAKCMLERRLTRVRECANRIRLNPQQYPNTSSEYLAELESEISLLNIVCDDPDYKLVTMGAYHEAMFLRFKYSRHRAIP